MGETNEKLPLDVVHEQQCLVCRVFGSASMIGRIGISNFFPWNDSDGICAEFQPGGQNQVRANRVEVCHLVAIDRETGSVIGPFAQEVVPAGISFFGSIALSNYQAWQLGLIAQAIAAVDDGFAQLGSCKSRGFGVAKLSVESILHEQDAVDKTSPVGVGRLIGPQESKDYALLPDSVLTNLVGVIDGLRRRFLVRDEQAIRAWLDSGLSSFGML